MSDEIKNLVNEKAWEEYKQKNTDGYGRACIKIARRVMQYLDENPVEFNIGYHPDMTTPHGIVCHCDYDEGITGFMAGAVRQMVCICYKDGWKFWLADSISPVSVQDWHEEEGVPGDVTSKVHTAIDKGHLVGVSKEEVDRYAAQLLERYWQRVTVGDADAY